MKKVVIIGANNFQMPLIIKAKSLGYETHVFAWEEGTVGVKYADFFYPISIVEKEQILKKCKEIKPDAVISVAYANKAMGLLWSIIWAILIFNDTITIKNIIGVIIVIIGTIIVNGENE